MAASGSGSTSRSKDFLLLLVFVSLRHLSGTLGCSPQTGQTAEDVYVGMHSDDFEQVCFEELGCFDNSLICHKAGFPPNRPDVINTRFLLYTRGNERHLPNRMYVDSGDNSTLQRFDSSRETKVVIHGFTDNYRAAHIQSIKDALLEASDVNVILVDWRDGAMRTYPTSRNNIRVVARQTARLLINLQQTFPIMGNIHIIGHSLGAHTAGYVGQETGFIDRITGLDPAGPLFSDGSRDCRLDSNDASFVDVIHTNGHSLGLGLMDQLGHQDFYPNGGRMMPGCGSIELICHHLRSIGYFVSSIRNRERCSFDAPLCTSWVDFTAGLCDTQCESPEACSRMGYYVTRDRPIGIYYPQTTKYKPFC